MFNLTSVKTSNRKLNSLVVNDVNLDMLIGKNSNFVIHKAPGVKSLLLILVAYLLPFNAFAEFVGTQGFSNFALATKTYRVDGVPFLDSFYLNFTDTDHHIQGIQIEPYSPIPNPIGGSHEPAFDEIDIGYKDKSNHRQFFYNISHHVVDDPRIERNKISLNCNKRFCDRHVFKPNSNDVFVVIGFTFFYANTDHHIDEVGFHETDGRVRVFFNDKNDDDLFRFDLEYAYLPADLVRFSGTAGRANVAGGDSQFIPSGDSVIRGFKFNFRRKDHHIKDIGVMTRPGKVEVFYGDKNQDDKFDWTVDWAILRSTTANVFNQSINTQFSNRF